MKPVKAWAIVNKGKIAHPLYGILVYTSRREASLDIAESDDHVIKVTITEGWQEDK
jgi:hypothetical protein